MNPITKKQVIMKCLADGDTANLPEPSSKIETYLYIWCKGSGDIPTPANKEEMYFAYLASQAGGTGFNGALPKPESRKEIFLHAVAEGTTPTLKPNNRYELFLKGIATGGSSVMPIPQTVEEYYLKYLAENMQDDNTYGEIVLDKSALTIDENATGTIQVKLSTAPSVNQNISIILSNGNASIDKATLTFTPSNYNTYQTITVTGTHLAGNFNNNQCVLTFKSKKTVATKTCTVTVNNIDVDTTHYMYYGRLSFQDVGSKVIQFNEITEAMVLKGVADGKLTKSTPHTLGKTSLGLASTTAESDYQIVIVPAANKYTVTKDNGLGGKTVFDEETAGANGIDITINTVPCKLYGEILIAQGETFIYVD